MSPVDSSRKEAYRLDYTPDSPVMSIQLVSLDCLFSNFALQAASNCGIMVERSPAFGGYGSVLSAGLNRIVLVHSFIRIWVMSEHGGSLGRWPFLFEKW